MTRDILSVIRVSSAYCVLRTLNVLGCCCCVGAYRAAGGCGMQYVILLVLDNARYSDSQSDKCMDGGEKSGFDQRPAGVGRP